MTRQRSDACYTAKRRKSSGLPEIAENLDNARLQGS
jgi:hypothetical protein